jgi:hypothetical protein
VRYLTVIVDGSRPPGLYRWRSRAHPAAVSRDLAPADIQCHVLDGARVWDEVTLFVACAAVLRFPDRFSDDWAGLADCLADRSWLPGRVHVVIWEHYGTLARNDLRAWETARDIFGVQATMSGKDGPPLYVLLRGPGPSVDLPVL